MDRTDTRGFISSGSTGRVSGPGPDSVRDRLVLALDVSSLDEAVALARRLRQYFGVVKVGLELFAAEGPLALDALLDEGFGVFCDLKLHDIPTTVGRAAKRIGALGASYLTVHCAGGEAMMKAATAGFEEGWAEAVGTGRPEPREASAGILGVTVLTSEADVAPGLVASRALSAARSGCLGAVCAASDLATVLTSAPGLVRVVPGIRLEGSGHDDQARISGPAEALAAGADLLVVGRTVTSAPDPVAAAEALFEAVATAALGAA